MKNIIYKNVNLKYILESINHGTIGLEENDNIGNYIITSEKYSHIVIKPIVSNLDNTSLNATQCLNILEYLNNETKNIDTDYLCFIVFSIDEDSTLVNMDLTEYLLIQNDNNFILYNEWNLIKI